MMSLEALPNQMTQDFTEYLRDRIGGYMFQLRQHSETPVSSRGTVEVLEAAILDGAPTRGLIEAAHTYVLYAHEQNRLAVAHASQVIYERTGFQTDQRVQATAATILTPWTVVGGAARGFAVDRFGLNKGRAMTPCTWWPGSGDVSQPGGFW